MYLISLNGFHPAVLFLNTGRTQKIGALMTTNVKSKFIKFVHLGVSSSVKKNSY